MLTDELDAVARLRAGEVIALPTDTVYGLVAAAGVAGATARLFAIKGRPESVALPVLVADPDDAYALGDFDAAARALVDAHWPGALTIVVRRTEVSDGWDIGGDGGTIGLRCPDDDVVRSVARAVGPLAVTSANRHGEAPCTTAHEVVAALGDETPVLDGGHRAGTPSTVVDVTGDQHRILRQGSVHPLL